MKRKIFIALSALFVIIQFFRADQLNPPKIAAEDFFAMNEAPEEIASLIHSACYDCHSHHTSYPWYSQIAPVSWWMGDHVSEGRSHMNFSTWSHLSSKDVDHTLEEIIEVLEKKEMPMLPYMIMHKKAWINAEQRAELAAYFQSLR